MADLRSIYIANGVGIFLMLILLYAAKAKILRKDTEDKLFAFMIVGVMFGCVVEALAYTVDGQIFAGSRILNYAANTFLFTMNMLLPLTVLVYVDIGLYGDTSRIWKNYKPQILTCVFMFVMTLVNFFIPISYYISEANVYERRPFSYVYYIVILYLIVTAIYVTIQYQKETGAKPFLNILFFLLPILVGAGVQFAFYGLSLAWLSASVGLVCLFMMQQNEQAYIDALVGTYNRQYMNNVISAWINSGSTFAGIMIDVDRFKDINDTFGHSAGDRTLKDVTDILKSARSENELVFRFAGDEFVVLKKTKDQNGLDSYMENVESALQTYNEEHFGKHSRANQQILSDIALQKKPPTLGLSYGSSFYSGGEIDAFLKDMDDNMYSMKSIHHSTDRRRSTDH